MQQTLCNSIDDQKRRSRMYLRDLWHPNTFMTFAMVFMILALPLVITGAASADDFEVINHVFTSRVIQDRDGAIYPQDTLIGFQTGTASFHSVTHIALQSGTYNLTMELRDPAGRVISSKQLPTIRAQHNEWTEALWVEWKDIHFSTTGRHELRILHGQRVVATFRLVIS